MPKGHAVPVASPKISSPTPTEKMMPAAGASVLRQQFGRMRDREPGTRAGDDIEELHQMRVATRRLRAALRLFVSGPMREVFSPFEQDVRALAAALGAVRDLDVFRDELRIAAGSQPADATGIQRLLVALDKVRELRRVELIAVLDAPATSHIWHGFPFAVDELERSKNAGSSIKKTAPRLLRRHLDRVTTLSDTLLAPTSLDLHDLRIQCKRLRYACEFFKPWYDVRLDDMIRVLTALQNTLGTLHDGDVATTTLAALVVEAAKPGGNAPNADTQLAGAVLRIVQDRQNRRDELLQQFRAEWKELRQMERHAKLKAT